MTSGKTTTLGEASYINPRLTERLDDDASVAFVPMAAVSSEEARVIASTDRPYSEVKKGYTYFESGDVLVAKITPCFENGKIAQANLPHKVGFGSTEFHVVRPRRGVSDGRYLHHYLRQPQIRLAGERRMTGSGGQRRVPEDYLASLPVPLPPVAEQRRIAAILDQADALVIQRRQALLELDKLAQAVFVEMFGDPTTNSLNLPVASLGSLGVWSSGGTPPRRIATYFAGSIPWFSSGELESMYVSKAAECISELAIKETSAKRVPAGSVMLGMYDTAALKASIAAVECSCNQAIAFCQLNPELAEATYVYSAIVIGREHFRRLQRGVRQKNLNLSMIRDIRIPAPPILRQREFTTRLQAIESLKTFHSTALAQSENLFASLQHHAFTGVL